MLLTLKLWSHLECNFELLNQALHYPATLATKTWFHNSFSKYCQILFSRKKYFKKILDYYKNIVGLVLEYYKNIVGLDTLPADHKVPRVKNLVDGKPSGLRRSDSSTNALVFSASDSLCIEQHTMDKNSQISLIF